jgi:hypothetical protein
VLATTGVRATYFVSRITLIYVVIVFMIVHILDSQFTHGSTFFCILINS